jgi:hypothetical protein
MSCPILTPPLPLKYYVFSLFRAIAFEKSMLYDCKNVPYQPSFQSKFEELYNTFFLCLANTKGNKRSRTRTDSYSAGQSVGGCPSGEMAAPVPFLRVLLEWGSLSVAILAGEM